MRRQDKYRNIEKANLILEQSYTKNKGLLTEATTINDTTKAFGGDQEGEDKKDSNKKVVNITEKQMDMLHKKGICECGDKCLVYWEGVKDDDSKLKELMNKLATEKTNCVIITKEQMDMLHKDGKCECDDNVSLSYKDEKIN